MRDAVQLTGFELQAVVREHRGRLLFEAAGPERSVEPAGTDSPCGAHGFLCLRGAPFVDQLLAKVGGG